jgi:hypothetical protein
MLAAGLIITSTALQNATKNVREELSKTNDELRWIIARKNLVIWNLRGSLSRNLHGPIQSAIRYLYLIYERLLRLMHSMRI